jgi:DivIVA domain-containing protein
MPDQSSAATEHAILQEITAPLERLPEDPLALIDAEFPTAMRGYDRNAVDDYVQSTRRLVAELHATRSPEAAVRRALERVGDQVAGILQRAHETAEEITARSRSESEDRLEQARREAARLLEAAEDRVRELDADADRIWAERQRIVADAEDLSAQLHALALDAGERFADPEPPAEEIGEAEEVEEAEPEDAELADEPELADAPEPADAPASAEDPGIDRTVAFSPLRLRETEPRPREPASEDSTRIIPPSSDAATRRQRSE